MNRDSLAIIIAAAVVILGGGIAIYSLNQKGAEMGASSSMASMDMHQHAGAAEDSGEAVATGSVTIKGFSFSPRTITVKVGTTVTWTNQDGIRHNVTTHDGNGPDGPLLAKGESYSYTFKRTGMFNYHCHPHPDMKGTVIVTD